MIKSDISNIVLSIEIHTHEYLEKMKSLAHQLENWKELHGEIPIDLQIRMEKAGNSIIC